MTVKESQPFHSACSAATPKRFTVIPAQVGIQGNTVEGQPVNDPFCSKTGYFWIPACAGMTMPWEEYAGTTDTPTVGNNKGVVANRSLFMIVSSCHNATQANVKIQSPQRTDGDCRPCPLT
ncbi:hypothetical protein [Vampirovibrio chlorellavorus]|uniref:hypothetical protein n=1 Tax=Vampirovibrio chlorellavorus TaxID=758823 RepID=UPI0026F1B89B|nr:hypothetical protein [Vampirovibrio chlorellavorus]